jgi:hypothetical protein
MLIENEFEVAAPLEAVWKHMQGIPRIAPCLPGAEARKIRRNRPSSVLDMSTDRDAGYRSSLEEGLSNCGAAPAASGGGYRRGQGSRGSDALRARDGCPSIVIVGY